MDHKLFYIFRIKMDYKNQLESIEKEKSYSSSLLKKSVTQTKVELDVSKSSVSKYVINLYFIDFSFYLFLVYCL